MLRAIRYLLVLTAVLAILLTSGYLGAASLIGALAPLFAETLGLDDLSITTSRPGLHSIEIMTFRVRTNGAEVKGVSGELTYDLLELLDGRFQSLRFSTVAVTVNPRTPPADDTDTRDSGSPPLPAAVFAIIPVAELTIDFLTLSIPRLDFLGRGSMQLANGRLVFAMIGLQPAQAEHFKIEGEVDDTGTIQVSFFDVNSLDQPFLTVDSTVNPLASAQVSIDTSFELTNYALQLAAELTGAPQGKGTLRGKVHTELPWPLTDTSLDEVVLNGTFHLNWQDAEDRLQLRNLHGGFVGQLDSIDAVLEGGDLEVGGSALSMTFPPGYPVAYRNGMITMGAGLAFTVTMGEVTSHGNFRSLEAQLQPALIVDLDTDLSISGFDLEANGRAIVHAEMGSGGELLAGNVALMVGDIDLVATFDHHFSEERGNLSSNPEITVTTPLLAGVFETWTQPYDVTAGQITAKVDLAWFRDKPLRAEFSLSISELDGVYDEYLFHGISGNLLVHVTGADVELAPSPITIKYTDVGLKLTDISLEAAWRNDLLRVKGMEMQLLGGSAVFSPITFAGDETPTTIDVELKRLSLAEVLALEGEDISGTGVLNGRLPIRIDKGLVSMTNGQLTAEAPGGTIRLATDFGASTGQLGLDFALSALTNFSYSKLDIRADYAENGDLALAVNLQGTNPDVEKGRAIVYNLTINENVLVLLESLRAQNAIIDRVERGILKK